ncbi:hypothetical protein ACFLUJ_03965 [Chloroflexota bacterium]
MRTSISDKKLPKRIRNILTEDENIERSYDLRGCKVYVTNKRLLELRGRTVVDYNYSHISSIKHTSKRHWWVIIFGIVIIAAGVFTALNIDSGDYIMLGLILVGLLLLVIGVIVRPEWVIVNVVGLDPVKYKGSKDKLDSLLQVVRAQKLNEKEAEKTRREGTS